jgi:hypothetical protein
LKTIIFFNRYGTEKQKKVEPIHKKILVLKSKKLSLSSQIYEFRIRDPRTGITEKPIPDFGSRGQKDTGSRLRIINTDEFRAPDPKRGY